LATVPDVVFAARLLRSHLGWCLALLILEVTPACTWLVDANASQCVADRDCARFGGARCDRVRGFCVASAPVSDAAVAMIDAPRGPSCRGPAACELCAGGREPGLANACSGAACSAFDNRRLSRPGPDGGLRPLPAVIP